MRKTKISLLSLHSNSVFPPLGIGHLAAWLDEHVPGVDVRIFDANFEDVEKRTIEWGADVVGATATTFTWKKACAALSNVKTALNVPTVIGGFHVSLMPEAMPKNIDFGVIGEGEVTFAELIRAIRNGLPTDQIAGTCHWEGDKLIVLGNRDAIDLATIPMLDYRHMAKQYLYPKYHAGKLRSMATIASSRGCPFSCRYCCVSAFWKRQIRAQTPGYVARHAAMLMRKYGIDHIEFLDDFFIANPTRLHEMIRAFGDEGILGKVTMAVLTKASSITRATCLALKELGVTYVGFGWESSSPSVLRYLKGDNASVEGNSNAITLLKAHGILSGGNMMMGSPTEKIKDMEMSADFMRGAFDAGAHASVTVTTPLPGTALWDLAISRGKINPSMDIELLDFNNPSNAMLLDDDVDREQFVEIFNSVYKLDRIEFWKTAWELMVLHAYGTFLAVARHPFFYLSKVLKLCAR